MDKTNLSGKRYLFALSIINDALDDWTEERLTAMILDITEIKESLLKEHLPTESDMKTPKKYQNNEGVQNNRKVSK